MADISAGGDSWQLSFPPFFTLQKHAGTQKKQLETWSSLGQGTNKMCFFVEFCGSIFVIPIFQYCPTVKQKIYKLLTSAMFDQQVYLQVRKLIDVPVLNLSKPGFQIRGS